MSDLINKKAVKEMALEMSRQTRAGKFTRVGASFIERVNARVRNVVADEVRAHPSKGVTLL